MNSRAIVSGFAATAAMLLTFIVAYGIAVLAAGVNLNPRRGAADLREWFHGLTNNSLIDFGRDNFYVAIAVFILAGVIWALIYAHVVEPRLRGPAWLRGVVFSLVPWLLSLIVFLPLVGGGFFGFALGAGPLPIIGNFVLHLVYGATLGLVYGPFGDRVLEAPSLGEEAAMEHSEAIAARGLVVGVIVGVAIGLIGLMVALASGPGSTVLGSSPLAFVVASAILGGTIGVFVGSLAGLPSIEQPGPRAG